MMKKILLILMMLLTSLLTVAQDIVSEDSIPQLRFNISGFGGLLCETSSINKSIGVSLGAEGALIFNNMFFIGGYATGLTTNHYINDLGDSLYYGKPLRVNFSHAGFLAGVVIMPKKRVHLSVSSRFGWGHIYLTEKYNYSFIYNVNSSLDYTNDKVFVIIPQVELEVNITPWLKFNLGVGYRYVSGINFERYKNYGFSYPQITAGFYFGGFNPDPDDDYDINPEEDYNNE